MSGKRPYCRADKPFPVGARALRTLAALNDESDYLVTTASRQCERLRRSGYIRVEDGRARITEAGRALLQRKGNA